MKSILKPFIDLVSSYRQDSQEKGIRIEQIIFRNDRILESAEKEIINEDIKVITSDLDIVFEQETVLEDLLSSVNLVSEEGALPLSTVADPSEVTTNVDAGRLGGFPEEMDNSKLTQVGGAETTHVQASGSTELIDPTHGLDKVAEDVTIESEDLSTGMDPMLTEELPTSDDLEAAAATPDCSKMINVPDEMPDLEDDLEVSEESISEMFGILENVILEAEEAVVTAIKEAAEVNLDALFEEFEIESVTSEVDSLFEELFNESCCDKCEDECKCSDSKDKDSDDEKKSDKEEDESEEDEDSEKDSKDKETEKEEVVKEEVDIDQLFNDILKKV